MIATIITIITIIIIYYYYYFQLYYQVSFKLSPYSKKFMQMEF